MNILQLESRTVYFLLDINKVIQIYYYKFIIIIYSLQQSVWFWKKQQQLSI